MIITMLFDVAASAQVAQLAAHAIAGASAKASGDPTLWYITRAAAISAYALLALGVVLGLARSALRAARIGALGSIWLLDGLHPFAAILAAAFIALHLVTLVFDPVVPFSLANLVLPVGEPYAPLATSLGVLSLYGIAMLLFSSWLRRALPYSFWRGLHSISFAAFALVTLHGILAGTDTSQPWMRAVYGVSGAMVMLLVLVRLLARPQSVPSMA